MPLLYQEGSPKFQLEQPADFRADDADSDHWHWVTSVESQLQAIVRGYHEVLQDGNYKRAISPEPGTAPPHPAQEVHDERWLRFLRERVGESQDPQVSSFIVPSSRIGLTMA
jgi:hypothetical protein